MSTPDVFFSRALEIAQDLADGERLARWNGSGIKITFPDPFPPEQETDVQGPQKAEEAAHEQSTSGTDAPLLVKHKMLMGATTTQAPIAPSASSRCPEPTFGAVLADIFFQVSTMSDDPAFYRMPPMSNLHRFPVLGYGASFVARLVPTTHLKHSIAEAHDAVVCKSLRHAKSESDPKKRPTDDRVSRLEAFLRELRVLTHNPLRNHENIVQLIGIGWERNRLNITSTVFHWPILILQYATYGSMVDFLEEGTASLEERRRLCVDAGMGLEALHTCDIVHGDVKLENILVYRHSQRKYVAKIADFGYTLFNLNGDGAGQHHVGRTEPWDAPESRRALSWNNCILTDVYSYGILLWRTMCYGHFPFDQNKGMLLDESKHMLESFKQRDEVPELATSSLEPFIKDSNLLENVVSAVRKTAKHDPSQRQLRQALDCLEDLEWSWLSRAVQRLPARSAIHRNQKSIPLRNTVVPYDQGLGIWAYGSDDKQLFHQYLSALESHYLFADSCGENISPAAALVQQHAAATLTGVYAEHHYSGDLIRPGSLESTLSVAFSWLLVSAGTGSTASAEAIMSFSRAFDCEGEIPNDSMLPVPAGEALYLGSEFMMRDFLERDMPGRAAFLDDFTTKLCRGAGIRLSIAKAVFDGSGARFHEFLGQPYRLGYGGDDDKPDGTITKEYLLRIAAGWGSLKDVQMLAQRYGADVDSTDFNGETALLKACRAGHAEVVEYLVKYGGARANVASKNGVTPLHWLDVFPSGQVPAIAALLCAAKGDPNAVIPDHLPRPDGTESRYWFFRGPPLMRVVASGNLAAVRALLDVGADPLVGMTGTTGLLLSPLGFAVRRARIDVVRAIMEKVDIEILWRRPPSGSRLVDCILKVSPFYLAKIHRENFREAQLMTFAYFWSRADATERQFLSINGAGDVAIQIAVEHGNLPLVKYILESCPDGKADLRGIVVTAGLQAAIRAGRYAIFKYLLEAGGDPLCALPDVEPGVSTQFDDCFLDSSRTMSFSNYHHQANSLHLCAFVGPNGARMCNDILHQLLPSSRWDESPETLRKKNKINCTCVNPPPEDSIVDSRNDNDETPFFVALRQQEYAVAFVLHEAGASVNVLVRGRPLVEHLLKWNHAYMALHFLIRDCWGCLRMTLNNGGEFRTTAIFESAAWPVEEAAELIHYTQERAYPGWRWNQEIEIAICTMNEAAINLILSKRESLIPLHTSPQPLFEGLQSTLVSEMEKTPFDSSNPDQVQRSLRDRGSVAARITRIILTMRDSYPDATLCGHIPLDILAKAKEVSEAEIRWRGQRFAKGLVSLAKLQAELNRQLFPWLVCLLGDTVSARTVDHKSTIALSFGQEVERLLKDTAGQAIQVRLDTETFQLRLALPKEAKKVVIKAAAPAPRIDEGLKAHVPPVKPLLARKRLSLFHNFTLFPKKGQPSVNLLSFAKP